MLASILALGAGFTSPSAAVSVPEARVWGQDGASARADRLEALANQLMEEGDVDRWEEVAELLESSARLRPKESLKKVTSLKMAANLFGRAGATEHARDLFEEAAEEAWQMGALPFAAHTYLDAAVLSAQLRMGRHTVRATQTAEQIAASPGMPREDRLAIEARIEGLGLPTRLAEIL